MLHPHTQIRHVSDKIGYGIFATEFIPKGTLIWVEDELEIITSPEKFDRQPPDIQAQIEKYSTIDKYGNYSMTWDLTKYLNHCCQCNSMSTGYGFEIAVRDIQPGEEILVEYGIYNVQHEMELKCPKPGCRCVLRPDDFDRHYKEWDERLKPAIGRVFKVEQPLLELLNQQTLEKVKEFLADEEKYISVYALKFHGFAEPDGATVERLISL